MAIFINTEIFIKKAISVHGNRYCYNKSDYKKSVIPLIITCIIHGDFKQSPNSHLNGSGCPYCGKNACSNKLKSSSDDFINQAIKVHGSLYDYSSVIYINARTKVDIKCKIHGMFKQTPDSHINKSRGCPKCGVNRRSDYARKKCLFGKYKDLIQPEDYKIIPLPDGRFTIVDNDDFDKVKGINWSANKRGYVSGVVPDMGKIRLHRFIMNSPIDKVIDHIDGDVMNNRKKNLRSCSQQQNTCNQKPQKGKTSKYKGVYWSKYHNKWASKIKYKGINYFIGYFHDQKEAAIAYNKEAKIKHLQFSRLNIL